MHIPFASFRSRLTAGAALLGCLLAAYSLLPATAAARANSVQNLSKSISYNGKTYAVKYVAVDLTDPYLRVKPVTAEDGIGHVEDFSSMMARNHAVAGVNGAFFDSYEKDDSRRYPNGLLVSSGEPVHSGINSSFLVLPDKTAALATLKTSQDVTVLHSGASPYTFTAWGVNKYYGESVIDQVVWYTRDFGTRVDFPNTTKVVIREHRITEITQAGVTIPEDGYVCMVGNSTNNKTYIVPSLHIGDTINIKPTYTDSDTGVSGPLGAIDAAVGAGPRLLKDGAVDIDFARDGFTDPKITTQANGRSFVGIDASGRMVIGTMSSATIRDMAQVLLKLGLTDAMNLDGGASSALYANGSVLTAPGRLLSNAWIVEKSDTPQIQIAVNGSFVHEFRGYLQHETTMVPLRGILERIGAEFAWNGDTRTLTVAYNSNQLTLHPGDSTMLHNGRGVALPEAPTIVDGHIYLPLRTVTEALGAQIAWDPELYRASLAIP
ncbi:phosphodiester glycosidase family protein [Paenibacillus athensensis]|nr:phosphodiester glycosidase family protein [Paenibacillus athensensis]MCD1261135.1 phosphodiester glycosidase family protein [Paenibacillus athensensis]